MLSCAEQAKLRSLMIEATKVFSTLVGEWTAKIGTMSKSDHNAMRGKVEVARLAMDNARTALELHIEKHGC